MADLRNRTREDSTFPPVVFVHQGTPEEGEDFFHRHWPEARAIADPEKTLFEAFGRERAGWSDLVRPGLWMAGARALIKGHRMGDVVGDPRTLPGLFLIQDACIVWEHAFSHSGDLPDLDAVKRRTMELENSLSGGNPKP